jgi:hypothetical protein
MLRLRVAGLYLYCSMFSWRLNKYRDAFYGKNKLLLRRVKTVHSIATLPVFEGDGMVWYGLDRSGLG